MNALIIFSRIAIGSTLLVSSLSKIRNLGSFQKAIGGFQLLPTSLHKIAGFAFAFAELTVAVVMLLGGEWLLYGFIAATLLFTVFTIALFSVLIRRIRVECNCFGLTNKPVSHYEIVRNLGFIFWGIVGWTGVMTLSEAQMGFAETLFLIFLALAYVAIWINLPEIMRFLKGTE